MSFLLPGKMKISEICINSHILFVKLNGLYNCNTNLFSLLHSEYLNKKFIENSEAIFNLIQLIRFSVGNFFLTWEQMKRTHTTVLKEFRQIMSNRKH